MELRKSLMCGYYAYFGQLDENELRPTFLMVVIFDFDGNLLLETES